MTARRFIQRIADQICEICDPERVILFGSYAKGQADVRSDVDLLVISASDSDVIHTAEALNDLRYAYPVGIDFHCVTQAVIARSLAIRGSLYHSAMQSGVELYCKK